MAFSTNGGGYRSSRRGNPALSEINVTPFVDVVLVLLIIFMLTAHVLEFGIEVDVPKVRPVKESAEQDMPVVTITKDGVIKLNADDVNINDLPATIRQKFGKAKGVYVRADKETIWDPIAQVTAELGAAGFQVNMVTQPEDSSSKGRR
jgi:biopolymer transport protein ExbD